MTSAENSIVVVPGANADGSLARFVRTGRHRRPGPTRGADRHRRCSLHRRRGARSDDHPESRPRRPASGVDGARGDTRRPERARGRRVGRRRATARRRSARRRDHTRCPRASASTVTAGRPPTPPSPSMPIDTTGAGDAFCGNLAARLAAGDDLDLAVRWASAAGALATTDRRGRPVTPPPRRCPSTPRARTVER